jgi:hypothetical protein
VRNRAVGQDGREWRVRREWMPRRPRWREREQEPRKVDAGDVLDVAGTGFDMMGAIDDTPALLVPVLITVAAVLAWIFLLPALIFLADVVFLLVVAAVGVALRVLFRRPWKVVAESDDEPVERFEFPVVGFRASGAEVATIEQRIRTRGHPMGG